MLSSSPSRRRSRSSRACPEPKSKGLQPVSPDFFGLFDSSSFRPRTTLPPHPPRALEQARSETHFRSAEGRREAACTWRAQRHAPGRDFSTPRLFDISMLPARGLPCCRLPRASQRRATGRRRSFRGSPPRSSWGLAVDCGLSTMDCPPFDLSTLACAPFRPYPLSPSP